MLRTLADSPWPLVLIGRTPDFGAQCATLRTSTVAVVRPAREKADELGIDVGSVEPKWPGMERLRKIREALYDGYESELSAPPL